MSADSPRTTFHLGAMLLLGTFFSFTLHAAVSVIDDEGQTLLVEQPARRIISLSPHATELLFAAGATDQIIATVEFADYPPTARKIPRIGGSQKSDLESIIALRPDLIIGWKGGGSAAQLNAMQKLGYRLYYSEPREFEDIARNIVNMGVLLGTEKVAKNKAAEFLAELQQLKNTYASRKRVNVFYQVWNQPLMTINSDHLITRVIEFCGGHNVFGESVARAPRISIESVIQAAPDAIVLGTGENREGWADAWLKWNNLAAVQNGHVYEINADLIVRQGPRIVLGARAMCEHLDRVRNHIDGRQRDATEN